MKSKLCTEQKIVVQIYSKAKLLKTNESADTTNQKIITLSKRENMSTAMENIEQSQLRSELPELRVGSSVRVNYRISEGNKERIQAFEGVIIGKHCGVRNNKATFTVRKVTQGYGVERIFPLHSPRIESIDIIKVGKVRQAKLYYLRALRGKAARIKERITARPTI